MKNARQKLMEFYHAICGASMHVLLAGMVISGLLCVFSIILHFAAGAFTYQVRVQQISAGCGKGAAAIFIVGMIVAFAVDIFVKNREIEADKENDPEE